MVKRKQKPLRRDLPQGVSWTLGWAWEAMHGTRVNFFCRLPCLNQKPQINEMKAIVGRKSVLILGWMWDGK